MTRTQRATSGMTPQEQAIASIADEYDWDPEQVKAIYDPSLLRGGKEYAAAGIASELPPGADPANYARNPIFLRKPGDRLPTDFEIRNQWAYKADREPIIGDGGETLNVNSPNIDDAIKFTYAGYVPPSGSPAYKALANFYSSKGETLEQTLQRLEVTGTLGQQLQQYPTGLAKVTNKDAIPVASSVVYNPPAYKTVDLGDGFTKTVALDVGWDGKPAGYTVQADIATSPKNVVATKATGVADDPNFVPTKNPEYWILPNGVKVKSVPGSSDIVGFNGETWKWQIKPEEIGPNTTWDMIARNPITGELDLSMITRESAQKAQELGILPTEYQNLLTEAPSMNDMLNINTSSPIGVTQSTTAAKPPAQKTTTTKTTGAPAVQDVSKTMKTGGSYEGTGAMYAQPKPPTGAITNPETQPHIGAGISPGQERPPAQIAPNIGPVGGLPGGAAGAVKPVVPNPISLPRMTAL